jgi:methionyl-tRNA formyltransferase
MARLAFLGTPEIAVVTLNGLMAAGHEIPVVVSRPDVRRGRGSRVEPSPVKRAAQAAGLLVSDSLDDLDPDLVDAAVVVAFGRIIPDALLERLLMINLHFSLLPRWRGAAPLERAILAGDDQTGVCLMKVVSELDAGDVYATYSTAVDDKTLEELRAELATAGTTLLVDALELGVEDLPEPEAQVGEATYAKKITTGDLELDFRRTADEVARVVRIGRAFTFLGDRRIGVLGVSLVSGSAGTPGTMIGTTVATGRGSIEITQVKPEGSRPMDAASWVRGLRLGGPVLLGRTSEPKVEP